MTTSVYYYFFDRSAIDPIWKMSWQDFLRMYGKSRWAKGPNDGNGSSSLRGLIAFGVEPEPSDAAVEDMIRRRTIRWTLQHSSPQFYIMEEILDKIPRLRSSHVSLEFGSSDWVALLAAATDGYFQGTVSESKIMAVLKLHFAKFEDFIRLSNRELLTLRKLRDLSQVEKPIYRWQGPSAVINGEEWAGCLGVRETTRFLTLIDQLWSQNPQVTRILDTERIQLRQSTSTTHCFRDFQISRQLEEAWTRKIRIFERPCVFRRWE